MPRSPCRRPEILLPPQPALPAGDRPPVELLVSVRSGKDMDAEQGAAGSTAATMTAGRTMPGTRFACTAPQPCRNPAGAGARGHTAYINHSESVPTGRFRCRGARPGGYPMSPSNTGTCSGVAVRPRFDGDALLLDISARSDRWSEQAGGVIDSTAIETTIPVEIGQWTRLGGPTYRERSDLAPTGCRNPGSTRARMKSG